MASSLLPELLGHIFDRNLDKGPYVSYELKKYSLVCSNWRYPAQRELFKVFRVESLSNAPLYPNSLEYSMIAKDRRHSHIGPAIQVLWLSLRIATLVDPDFHLFLRNLTSVKTLRFGRMSSRMLFQEHFTPEIRSALQHLLRIPTLRTLVVNSNDFPLSLILYCAHLRQLRFHWNHDHTPNPDHQYDFREHQDTSAPNLAELILRSDARQLAIFTTWLRDPRYNISIEGLQRMELHFHSSLPTGSKTFLRTFVL